MKPAEVSTPSKVACHCRSDMVCSGTSRVSHQPAFATNVSTRPKRFSAAANTRRTSTSLARSARTMIDSTDPSFWCKASTFERFLR